MSEFQPNYDLNHRAPSSALMHVLGRRMQHDSLQVILEDTPKAVVGGTLVYPRQNAPAREYLVGIARYDSEIKLPSSDGVFYDVHIALTNDTQDFLARFAVSDMVVVSAEPYSPLNEHTKYMPIIPDRYQHLGEVVTFASFGDEATEEALGYLEQWQVIQPRTDMPFYDLAQAFDQELGGAA